MTQKSSVVKYNNNIGQAWSFYFLFPSLCQTRSSLRQTPYGAMDFILSNTQQMTKQVLEDRQQCYG